MSALFAGVDAGGTHTRVLVTDDQGTELATADGAGSAIQPGSASHSAAVIRDAVRRATVGHEQPLRGLCVGVAGAGRDEERDTLAAALEADRVAGTVLVVTDAEIALEDAFGAGPGILLVAGTGSIAWGKGPTGVMGRCGGWGPVIGDEGSGAWIGRRALGVATASADGREPETGLTTALIAATHAGSADGLIPWAAKATPADLGNLAPAVLEVAAMGDLRANSLVTLAVEELALHVRTLARQLFADERVAFRLALHGGLLARGSLLRRRVEQRLKTMTPGAVLLGETVRPERGAVKLAMREAGLVRSA
ncbi:MAG TPA: BadF/BadG/BcrA/BcrD ATPase family protein [Gemmatimonadaceae bacterium]